MAWVITWTRTLSAKSRWRGREPLLSLLVLVSCSPMRLPQRCLTYSAESEKSKSKTDKQQRKSPVTATKLQGSFFIVTEIFVALQCAVAVRIVKRGVVVRRHLQLLAQRRRHEQRSPTCSECQLLDHHDRHLQFAVGMAGRVMVLCSPLSSTPLCRLSWRTIKETATTTYLRPQCAERRRMMVVFYLLWVSWAHEVAVVVVWSLRTVRGRELRGSTPGRVSQQRHFADEYSKLEHAVSTSFNLGKMKKSS
jgi:hypothetical protein